MTADEDLSIAQIKRYLRQIILPELKGRGQKKLLRSKVLLVGAGGLGCPAAMYLAAAGIGEMHLIDADLVDISNLHRQILHTTSNVGKAKVLSAKECLQAINPEIKVITHEGRFEEQNALELCKSCDFVIDGSDNFGTKFLVNDACYFAKTPFSHAGALRFEGQSMTVIPDESACYRCIFQEAPPEGSVPNCVEAGVMGALTGVVGSIQALEAIKYLTGIGELLTNRLLTMDLTNMNFRRIQIPKNPDCPLCGSKPTITELKEGAKANCQL